MQKRGELSEVDLDRLQDSSEDEVSHGSAAMRTLLGSDVALDGVACASDSLAHGALLVLDDGTPVVGYDNTPVAQAIGLSSVEQPLHDVASGVLDLLMGTRGRVILARSAEGPQHRLVTPRLIVRTALALRRDAAT